MESLLREYEAFCAAETERYDRREQTKDDYVFRRKGMNLPMTPSTFTWHFKKILKANDLPTDLNVQACATQRQACSSPAARMSVRLLDCSDTVNRRPRWISTPMPLIRTRKQPVRSCRATWKSELPAETLYPVALCSKSKESKHYHIKMT